VILAIAAAAAYVPGPAYARADPGAASWHAFVSAAGPSNLALYNQTAKLWRSFVGEEGALEGEVHGLKTICSQYQAATDPEEKQALAKSLQGAPALISGTVDDYLVPYLNHFMVSVDKLGAALTHRWPRHTHTGQEIVSAWKEVTHGKITWHNALDEASTAASDFSQLNCAGAQTAYDGIFNVTAPFGTGQVVHGMATLKRFASRR
jgi:hypothetical protein